MGETAPLRYTLSSRLLRGRRMGIRRRQETAGEMEQKKLKTFREKLILKKKEILEAYNKNKTYGKEADEDGAQDIADKASNSYTKEFLFSLSNNERDGNTTARTGSRIS